MTISFDGKVAVITGSGGGLGRQHALELARRGAKIVINDLGGTVDGQGGDDSAASVVAKEINDAGGTAIANHASVTDPEAAAGIISQAVGEWGRVDILINNAGILRDKSFTNMELADFTAVMDVHLMGAVNCTKAVWPVMREQNYGRIVMTTSSSGLYGNFGQTNYSAAKLSLVGFMNTLRLEGQKYNIFTNSIAPVAYTRMTEDLMPEQAADRMDPALVTPGVVFLCSEDAPNGIVLEAGASRFWMAEMFQNDGVTIENPTVEDVAENWEKISDMSAAHARQVPQRQAS